MPTTAADAVTAACDDPAGSTSRPSVAQAADAGNPVPPLVRALQAAVGERDAVAVHVGATSQDVLDTALMLLARRRWPRSRRPGDGGRAPPRASPGRTGTT